VTVLILIALYVALARNHGGPAPGPKAFRLVLREGRLTSSPAILDTVEGDVITLSILSDRPATLHVHGYEQQFVVPLNPGEEAAATFTAGRAGRFAVHVMGIDPTHPEVATIQVHPR
jgi:hypothetical protein